MADSDLSDAPSALAPPDAELESALRDQVRDAFKAGKGEKITVSSMRKGAEAVLGLEAGFFKQHEAWNKKSKGAVEQAFEEYENGADPPNKPKPKPKPETEATKPEKTVKPVKVVVGKKRASADGNNDGGAAKKRRKSQATLSSNRSFSSPPSDVDEEEVKPAKKAAVKGTKKSAKKGHKSDYAVISDDSSDDDKQSTVQNVENSDSDLSSLIDVHDPPKRRKQSTSSAKSRPKSTSTKSKPDANLDANAAEIKRLQGWLIKCGIRKLWGKELKPYETPKQKINHLKEMLADVGMTGRYSNEKASQIKEERELKADIEAVTEGEQRWGRTAAEGAGDKAGAEIGGEDGRTKSKRLVRGAQVLDFLSSDDGEETD